MMRSDRGRPICMVSMLSLMSVNPLTPLNRKFSVAQNVFHTRRFAGVRVNFEIQ